MILLLFDFRSCSNILVSFLISDFRILLLLCLFFNERMCRFGMTNNNTCERCQQVESTRHLLWDCVESRNIWDLFNLWIVRNSPMSNSINEYQDVFNIDGCSHVCKVTMKIIQEMIQIERPSGWNLDHINVLSNDIRRIELYKRAKC